MTYSNTCKTTVLWLIFYSSYLGAMQSEKWVLPSTPIHHISQDTFVPRGEFRASKRLAREISKNGCAFCCAKMLIEQQKNSINKKSHFSVEHNVRNHLKYQSDATLTTFSTNELIERHTGRKCIVLERWLQFDEVKYYIKHNKPIMFGYRWLTGHGHAMIISGYVADGDRQLIILNDPARGESITMSFYNLRSGRYSCDIDEHDLIEDLDTAIFGYWEDSIVLSDADFGIFDDNKENVDYSQNSNAF